MIVLLVHHQQKQQVACVQVRMVLLYQHQNGFTIIIYFFKNFFTKWLSFDNFKIVSYLGCGVYVIMRVGMTEYRRLLTTIGGT